MVVLIQILKVVRKKERKIKIKIVLKDDFV